MNWRRHGAAGGERTQESNAMAKVGCLQSSERPMRLLYLRNLGIRQISYGRSNVVDFTLFLCRSVNSIEQGSQGPMRLSSGNYRRSEPVKSRKFISMVQNRQQLSPGLTSHGPIFRLRLCGSGLGAQYMLIRRSLTVRVSPRCCQLLSIRRHI